MERYFATVNFTKMERLGGTIHNCSLSDLYAYCSPNVFLELLVKRVWVDPPSYFEKNPYSLGRLNIATELLDMIFKEIVDFADAMCFAVAHPRLMAIGEKRLRTLYEPYIAPPWAGDCFMVLGYSAKMRNLPHSAIESLSQEMKKEIGNLPIMTKLRGLIRAYTPPSVRREEMVSMLKKRVMRISGARRSKKSGRTKWTWKKVNVKAREQEKKRKEREALLEEKSVDWDVAEKFMARATIPQGKSDHWVLCNLSKHVYVRRNYLAKKNRTQEPRYGYECWGRLGLGSVLLRYTQCCKKYNRREWAGDRFVVMTLAELEKRAEAMKEEWKDVSEEVYQKLKKSGVRKEFATTFNSEEDGDSDEVESGSEYSEDFYYCLVSFLCIIYENHFHR